MEKQRYRIFNKFILRTPIFPLTYIDRICYESKSKTFDEALLVASPELHQNLHIPQAEAKARKINLSLKKYFLRSCVRCTPFGLFAGCSIGSIGTTTNLIIPNYSHIIRHIRIDMDFFCAIKSVLETIPEIRCELKFYPNDSIYILSDRLRYVEYQSNRDGRKHQIVEVKYTQELFSIIQLAKSGATIGEICEKFISIYPEVDYEDIYSFTNEIIDAQILKSYLEPNIFVQDPLSDLLNKLSGIKNVEIINKLTVLKDLISNLNSQTIGHHNEIYSKIFDVAKSLNIPYDSNNIIQVDTFKSVKGSISNKIEHNLQVAINFFINCCRYEFNYPELEKFKEAFIKKYEQQEIPLIQALDPELGIGYPANFIFQNTNPILSDIVLPYYSNAIDSIKIRPLDKLLLNKYVECIANGDDTIRLTDEDITLIQLSDGYTLAPETISIMSSMFLDSNGVEKIFVKYVSPFATRLISRFGYMSPNLQDFNKQICQYETDYWKSRNCIVAEISHLPESRLGNVISRTNMREYEIHYLSNFNQELENHIPVTDIMLAIKDNSIILKSNKYNKRIIPRLSCAHNYAYSTIPIYKFLCAMQFNDIAKTESKIWNPYMENLNYLPRICVGDIILSRQRWIINAEDLEIQRKKSITEWIKERKLPKYVLMIDGDNELLIDVYDDDSIQILNKEIKKRSNVVVEEFLFNDFDSIVKDENNKDYSNELIFSFYKI